MKKRKALQRLPPGISLPASRKTTQTIVSQKSIKCMKKFDDRKYAPEQGWYHLNLLRIMKLTAALLWVAMMGVRFTLGRTLRRESRQQRSCDFHGS